jgi:hypothetical protein
MESLRERRLAFRRKNTIRNEKSPNNHLPDFVQPSHPVRFQDRKFYKSEKKNRRLK